MQQEMDLPTQRLVQALRQMTVAEGGGDVKPSHTRCPRCNLSKPGNKMVPMLRCAHSLCVDCVTDHFQVLTRGSMTHRELGLAPLNEQNILGKAVCPICGLPDLTTMTSTANYNGYFNELKNLLKVTLNQTAYYINYRLSFECSRYCKICIDCGRASCWEKEESQTRVRCLHCADFAYSRSFIKILEDKRIRSTVEANLIFELRQIEFSMEDAIFCAQHKCRNINEALSYLLPQECQICTREVQTRHMVDMLSCVHRCCRDCAKKHFTSIIKEADVADLVCPFCHEPAIADNGNDSLITRHEYLINMDIVLKNLVDDDVHELFQRKVRDRALMNVTNFHWCTKCASGFIHDSLSTTITCPECLEVACARCNKKWEGEHKGISCQQFADWKEATDLECQTVGLNKYMGENGIACPKCQRRYYLSRGGCLHCTCPHCKYEFCMGCGNPFKSGGECKVFADCDKSGKHAHHPRNCVYYIRDMEHGDLKRLLKDSGVPFEENDNNVEASGIINKCGVLIEEELQSGIMADRKCGGDVADGQGGLCKLHYVEYLAGLIRKHNLDTVTILDVPALEHELLKHGLALNVQSPTQSVADYRTSLIQAIQLKLKMGK